MAKWLYNSDGEPVVFLELGKAYFPSGRFFAHVRGRELWRGDAYVGEVHEEDWLLFREDTAHNTTPLFEEDEMDVMEPLAPLDRLGIFVPYGFRDVRVAAT
jgi:hypothetical protein